MPQDGHIIIYTRKDGKAGLEVTFQDESVWLTQEQISKLFGTERSVITKHIRNIFLSKELDEKSNVQKMHITGSDKPVKYYHLNVIISVGYRTNSRQATQFRVWATSILRDHLVRGFTINERRLKEAQNLKLKELERTIGLLQGVIQKKELESSEARGLLSVITDYTNSWILLQRYDEGVLEPYRGRVRGISMIASEEAQGAIRALRDHLARKEAVSDIFGVERSAGNIGGILSQLSQSFDGRELYPSIEEKAAHLLYFAVKNHPFVDGNKRIASLLFIFFLSKNQYLHRKNGERKINDNALVALALLIAESKSTEKDVMVSLVTNLLRG